MAKKHTDTEDFFDTFPNFPQASEPQSPKKVHLELKTQANKTGRKKDFGDRPTKRIHQQLPIDTIDAFQKALIQTKLKPNVLLNKMILEYLERHGLGE